MCVYLGRHGLGRQLDPAFALRAAQGDGSDQSLQAGKAFTVTYLEGALYAAHEVGVGVEGRQAQKRDDGKQVRHLVHHRRAGDRPAARRLHGLAGTEGSRLVVLDHVRLV